MAKVGLLLCLLPVSTGFIFSVADAQSCNACNCQFDNVQVLSRLVEAEVNRTLADAVDRRVADEVNRTLADAVDRRVADEVNRKLDDEPRKTIIYIFQKLT